MYPLTRGRLFAAVAAIVFAAPLSAWSCPFCTAVQQTFSEEIMANDVAAIVQLVERPVGDDAESILPADPTVTAAKSTFKITHVIKGSDIDGVAENELIRALYFGQEPLGSQFLVYGVDPPKPVWTTPTPLTVRGVKYVLTLTSLPETGADRLDFFQKFLEDEDRMLAADAYDEFARAPYIDVINLADRMDHDQLVEWISDVELPASRRRLYLTMLGVCGTADDIPFLEDMITSDNDQVKIALDALVACYLKIKGPTGLPLVVDRFIKNQDAEYTDTYSTIMALRFHGQELEVIPKDDLRAAMRHMLDRPNLADLVIPDLARWEDWSVMDRLVTLFEEADENSTWVRVPVVNYLRACPLPEADAHIERLKKIDPEAVKRASYFFPLGASGAAPAPKPAAKQPAADEGATEAAVEQDAADETQTATPLQPAETSSRSGGSVEGIDLGIAGLLAATAAGAFYIWLAFRILKRRARQRVTAT